MSKFDPLTEFLSNQTERTLVLSFADIERIIAEPLCYSAHTYRAYWSPSKTHTMPNAIYETDYVIDDVDLINQRIVLKRQHAFGS